MMDCFWVNIYSSGQLAEHTWRDPSGVSSCELFGFWFVEMAGGEAYGS
jgi:hypothetical protein